MRILLVSDVHSNWPALEAVVEPHDVCFFLGDLVDYGCDPGPCVDWVRRRAQFAVRGNHDHAAAQRVVVEGASGFKYLSGASRPTTVDRLAPADRRYLADLPLTRAFTLGGKRFLLVHATPRDPLDEYGPPEVEFWSRRLEGLDYDFVCVGHTHVPYVLDVGGKTVVNPGSIGLSRDGDPRAAYAVIQNGRVELKRVEYPVERSVAAVDASPLPVPAKRMLAEVYRTGRLSNGHP
jgi:putative phosphoesterase